MTIDFSNGVDLTFEPDSRTSELIQSIFILLNTPRGSVPCYREFGIDTAYLHKPIQTAKTMYAAAITEGINAFIPGVQLNHMSFANNADTPSTLIPILEVTFVE